MTKGCSPSPNELGPNKKGTFQKKVQPVARANSSTSGLCLHKKKGFYCPLLREHSQDRTGGVPEESRAGELTAADDYLEVLRGCSRAEGRRASSRREHSPSREAPVPGRGSSAPGTRCRGSGRASPPGGREQAGGTTSSAGLQKIKKRQTRFLCLCKRPKKYAKRRERGGVFRDLIYLAQGFS